MLSIAAKLVLCEVGEVEERESNAKKRGGGKMEDVSNGGGWFLNQVRSVASRSAWVRLGQ